MPGELHFQGTVALLHLAGETTRETRARDRCLAAMARTQFQRAAVAFEVRTDRGAIHHDVLSLLRFRPADIQP